MAERRPARGLEQRKLDVSEPLPTVPPEARTDDERGSAPLPRPPILRDPSETQLRERQARWLRTRAEFEANERASRSPEADR